RADLLNRCAFTTRGFVSSPSPRILTPARSFLTSPSFSRRSGVISPVSFSSDPTFTTAYSVLNRLVNPRFGTRRCSGIWPPSKPAYCLRPERESCPLCPAVAVLPCPEPGPRPTRFGFFRDPLAGLRFARSTLRAMPVLHDPDQVRNGLDHAAHRMVVQPHHPLAQPAQPERPKRQLLPELAADAAGVLLDDDRPAGRTARAGFRGFCSGLRHRCGSLRPRRLAGGSARRGRSRPALRGRLLRRGGGAGGRGL